MEIALNSLVLFIFFVFPVIVFRRFYFRGVFSKQSSPSNWLTTFYMSLFPGLIIQVISFYAFTKSIYREPIPDVYSFLNSVYGDIQNKKLPIDLFNQNLYIWSFAYIFLTIIVAFIIAQICWKTVRYLELDIKFPLLRFDNYLHYYFSGECLKFPEYKMLSRDLDVIVTEVDVLADIGSKGTRLYKGLYKQHTISKETNELKAIYITDVRRFSDTPPRSIRNVPGHIMIIPAEKIFNINLNYVTVAHQNYYAKFIYLANLIVLLFLIYNKFGIPHDNSVLIEILERLGLFLVWLLIAAFINKMFNPPTQNRVRFYLKMTAIILGIFLFFGGILFYKYS